MDYKRTSLDQIIQKQCIIWFTLPTCGPCQRMDKQLLKEAAHLPFYMCDDPDRMAMYGIKQVPTFVYFNEGQPLARKTSSDSTQIYLFMKRLPKLVQD